jgi:alkanesulfonate monooxygenase SsuD/methylene tetrahydromethanopterin reductase-like flavin-dependent oxidoreductase (luciferase family)
MIRLTGLAFDMRAPDFGAPVTDLYPAALEMSAYADEIGIGSIGLMEHHASDDNYLPAPFVMGGAVAARTRNCIIRLGAIAVLDIVSGGRLEVIFGAGYVPSEFARFNASLNTRGKALDEGIELILRALKGERFTSGGRDVCVRPVSLQPPEQILYAGGGVAASARRAARFDIGFAPMNRALFDIYDAECRKFGREPGKKRYAGVPLSIHVSEDPERDWAHVVPHALHVVRAYAAWAAEADGSNSPFEGIDTVEKLRATGMFQVWTPEETIRNGQAMIDSGQSLHFMPLLGGMRPDLGWQSLRLVGDKVMPYLRN